MRNSILIEISEVDINEFNNKLLTPEFIEAMDGGVRILFHDMNSLNEYQASLKQPEDTEETDPQDEVIAKVNKALNNALNANRAVLDSVKAYAKALYSFVFTGDGHRKDRLFIFDTMVADIEESTNSWELEKAVADATFELGPLALDRRLTFMNYAHNIVDYNFDKLKDQLIGDLKQLRLKLVD